MNYLRLRRGGVNYAIQVNVNTGFVASTNVVDVIATLDVPAFIAGSFSLSNRFASVNGVQSNVVSASLFNGDCSSFTLRSDGNASGTVSFAAYFRGSALTPEQLENFRAIYKTTLGQGLTGLP
jgi:hypothetical protein